MRHNLVFNCAGPRPGPACLQHLYCLVNDRLEKRGCHTYSQRLGYAVVVLQLLVLLGAGTIAGLIAWSLTAI